MKPTFRVLIVGRANAGKTSILQRVCDTTDSPVVYRQTGSRREVVQLDPCMERCEHNIDDELVFSNCDGYIFHDSIGFEAGSTEELEIVQEFIRQRSGRTRPQERLHAIWYCIPMDNRRPQLDLKFFKDICPDQTVRVIAVFTKYDQFRLNVEMHLADYPNEYPHGNVFEVAEKLFKEHYLHPLGDDARFVRLEKTHRTGTRCDILLEVTAKALNEDVVTSLETDSFTYVPSFASSETDSIVSYKTERTINSRKSRYNALPRRKFADIGHSRLPQGIALVDVDEVSVLKTESFPNPLGIIPVLPIAPQVNFVEESRPGTRTQPLDQRLEIRESSISGFSIANMALQLERTINRWASEVLSITSAPAPALQEAILMDLTDVGQSTALFTNARQMVVQSLLQHAMAEVISDGIINSLIVTNSAEANLEFTRTHECLLSRDVAAAAVWRRHTFSVAVDYLSPGMLRMIFEENMPLLAALLPDTAEDPLGTRDVLEDAFKFSRMLCGAPASAGPDADAFYRSFVPRIATTLQADQIELVKRCRRGERGEVDRVGATIFPGLVKVLPTPPIIQTVVRRALVICECELLATGNHPVSAPVP